MRHTALPLNPLNPDRAALADIGSMVRERLSTNQAIYRVPTDKADIYALADFMSAAECERMIAMIETVAKPSIAFDTDDAEAFRTSYSGDVDAYDPFVLEIQGRIDELIGLPREYGETVQGQRYLPGQQFKPHFDWFDTGRDYWRAEHRRGGQRCITAMVYLNEVEAGGTTRFNALDLAVEPRPGALLLWNNATGDGEPNEYTLHAGAPVEAGVKYIITKWYRTRKWA